MYPIISNALMNYYDTAGIPAEENRMQNYQKKKNREVVNTRSLSLELAKHQHRLASQLVCAFDSYHIIESQFP